MNRTQGDQVSLDRLIFTCNWEDPDCDRGALSIKPEDTLLTVTSGGCNTLGFLLQDPERIYAVDINPCQSHLLELKIAAMRCLDHTKFTEFLGLRSATDRLAQYRTLRDALSPAATKFWDGNTRLLQKGVLLQGRYEKFVRLVGGVVRLVMGRRQVAGLFKANSIEEQQGFYARNWNVRRLRMLFNLFFNKRVLARRGLKADYFRFDDGSTSFAESFFKKFRRVTHDLPTRGNYFLHLYLMSRYRSAREVPDYLLEENYSRIKSRLDRIRVVTSDAKKWLADQEPESIDCFALSNICELMSTSDTKVTFEEVARTARRGARMCFRNLMIDRTVPEPLQDIIQRDPRLSAQLLAQDRSFVYSRVDALRLSR